MAALMKRNLTQTLPNCFILYYLPVKARVNISCITKSYFPLTMSPFTLNRLCQLDSSTSSLWTGAFSIERVLVSVTTFYRNLFFNANRVGPDQTPRSAASDLGLHGLSMSIVWDTRHKWVKHFTT